jgi:diketogulonate reductase-like aldo/keto reductase
MEKEYRAGKVKAIGLSNFNSKQIEEVFLNCEVRPAVNQIEVHPYLQNDALIEFCQLNNIVVEAFAPIGAGMKKLVLVCSIRLI